MSEENGWSEYSKLVLKELETLNIGIQEVKREIYSIKTDLTHIRVLDEQVKDLNIWRSSISEVCSPTQLKELTEEVDALRTFKTRAVTIFTVTQVIFGAVYSALSLLL